MDRTVRGCCECGEEIEEARLKAKPEAKVCIECQRGLERTGKFARHRMDVTGLARCGELDSVKMVLHRGG